MGKMGNNGEKSNSSKFLQISSIFTHLYEFPPIFPHFPPLSPSFLCLGYIVGMYVGTLPTALTDNRCSFLCVFLLALKDPRPWCIPAHIVSTTGFSAPRLPLVMPLPCAGDIMDVVRA